jgi:putative ABC transport system permease protein
MVGSILDRKLWRNLRELRGQVITIALVVACGIAAYVTMQSAYASLLYSKNAYYERYRFGDVFAHCKRAPEAVRRDLEALPGVARVDTRIVESAMLPIEGLPEPASASLVSVPGGSTPELNALYLYEGRVVEPGRSDEVVVLRTFAEAHGLEPGDRLPVVINGVRRELRVVGTAASPEFVLAIAPGDITPDPKRFAVLWMDRAVLAPAFQMEGAFNDVVLTLQPDASREAVLESVDRVLEPYGSFGALSRER